MATVKGCLIASGKVVNIAILDDQEPLPPDYVLDDGTAVKGGTWDGSVFGPVPQADIDAREDARLEALVDEVEQTQKAVKNILFEMYDRLAAAGVAGFPTLTNAQKRQFIKDRL